MACVPASEPGECSTACPRLPPPLRTLIDGSRIQDEGRWSVRGPDGRFTPMEEVGPMAEPFIGGFLPPPSPVPSIGPPPPPLPPKDASWTRDGRVASSASWSQRSRADSTYSTFANMSAVERSKHLRVARMSPFLQFMAGPLLRYDTVDAAGVWRGAAMIVSEYRAPFYLPPACVGYRELMPPARGRRARTAAADAGSVYELDGLKQAPVRHGAYSESGEGWVAKARYFSHPMTTLAAVITDWPSHFREVIEARIGTYPAGAVSGSSVSPAQ